jgi:dihydroorotase
LIVILISFLTWVNHIMQILIHGGRVIDPGNINGVRDILIDGGIITDIAESGKMTHLPAEAGEKTTRIINATGKIVTPGLIDMHVHLREPGFEHKETIASGCKAAVAGGFTAVCAMPNTHPVNDSPEVTAFMKKKAAEAGLARVYPAGAITLGLEGEELCDYGALKKAGVVALTDDGCPVENDRVMQRALEEAGRTGLTVISHSEVIALAGSGAMNRGPVAERLGLEGIPNTAESLMVEREIMLSEKTGARIHIAHVSTAESVVAIRSAKQRGVNVTAETAPHYFTLTDEAVEKYDTRAKMNPPLRSQKDRAAILQGLADDTLDVIATDHAPHSVDEKRLSFAEAPNGIIGLETSLPLGLRLVNEGVFSLDTLIEKMSTAPARIIGVDSGLRIGGPADLTIIDTEMDHCVKAAEFHSLGRNCPFDGWRFQGKAVLTMVAGRVVFDEGSY